MTPRQQSILVGAVVTGVLSTSYLGFINTFCCLGVIIGGLVAVQQYTSRTGSSIESGDGAIIGALSGVGGAVIGAVLDRALRPFGLDARSIQEGMVENMMQMQGQQDLPPILQQLQGGNGEMGLALFIFNIVFSAILYGIFGSIGGAIGAALFGEDGGNGGEGVQTVEAEIVE